MYPFIARYYILLCGIYAQVTVRISLSQMKRKRDINFLSDHTELFLQSNEIILLLVVFFLLTVLFNLYIWFNSIINTINEKYFYFYLFILNLLGQY